MYFKQISVFIENKPGTLQGVLKVLAGAGINILSTNLSDTSGFGLLRLVVSEPEAAASLLNEVGYTALLSEVFLTKIPHRPGALLSLLEDISAAGLNLDYMYNLNADRQYAYVVLKFSDAGQAAKLLKRQGIETIELSSLK